MIIKKTPLWLISLFTATGILLIVFITLGVWPFGDNSLLTGDLNGQYINYYASFQDALNNSGSFGYSFEKSLGGALEGILAYYCSSLLSFLYLLVPPIAFAKISGFVLLLKLVLSSASFCYFITKKYSLLPWQAVMLSQCYAFSSYIFAFGQNIMWMDAIVFLPMIALGVEEIVEHKKTLLFTAMLTLCIFSNFYIGFMVCIFSCIYFVYLCALKGETTLLFYRGRISKFAIGGLTAGITNAILLLPAIANISESKGIGLSGFSFSLLFSPLSIFRKMFAGSFTASDNMNGLPNIYCGLIIFALLIIYAICKEIPRREKICGLSLLTIMFLSLCVNGLNLLWHGTKEPVWFLYRNSFIFVFVMVLLAARVLSNVSMKPSLLIISGSLITATAVLILIFESGFNVPYLIFSLLSVICALGCIGLAYKLRNSVLCRVALCACCLFVIGELAFNARDILRRMEQYPCSDYENFYKSGIESVQKLSSLDNSARIEKNFIRSLCDPMLLGFRGVSHFGSTQDNNSVNALMELGYENYGGSCTYGAGSTAAADSFLGIKYLFANDSGFPVPAHYNIIEKTDSYTLYQNELALPTAFEITDKAALTGFKFSSNNPFEYQNEIYKALGGEQLLFKIDADKSIVTNEVLFSINALENAYYYARFDTAAATDEKAEIYVNGSLLGKYFDYTGFCDVINLGKFDKDEKIEILIKATSDITTSLTDMFYYTPISLIENSTDSLQRNACAVSYKGSEIHLDIKDGAKPIFISLPYTESFKAFINEKPIEAEQALSHFMLVDTKGLQGKLVLKYQSPFFLPSAIISIVGILLICLIAVSESKYFENLLKRRLNHE